MRTTERIIVNRLPVPVLLIAMLYGALSESEGESMCQLANDAQILPVYYWR